MTCGPSGFSAAHLHLHLLRLGPAAPTDALSAGEREHAGRVLDAPSRDRFVAARSGLRRLLGQALNMPPAEVPLTSNPQGKPQLEFPHDWLHFSVSHAGEFGLIGLAAGHALGVDLECALPRPGLLAAARRQFHPAEAAALNALAPEALRAAFYRLWTRREAVLKALGVGLGSASGDLEVSPWPRTADWLVSVRGQAAADWLTQDLDVAELGTGPGWQAAVAVQGGSGLSAVHFGLSRSER